MSKGGSGLIEIDGNFTTEFSGGKSSPLGRRNVHRHYHPFFSLLHVGLNCIYSKRDLSVQSKAKPHGAQMLWLDKQKAKEPAERLRSPRPSQRYSGGGNWPVLLDHGYRTRMKAILNIGPVFSQNLHRCWDKNLSHWLGRINITSNLHFLLSYYSAIKTLLPLFWYRAQVSQMSLGRWWETVRV